MNIQHCFQFCKLFTNGMQRKGDLFRTYLTATSWCNDSWNGRYTKFLVRDCKTLETSIHLVEKEANTGMVHALDIDVFVNSITAEIFPAVFSNLEFLLKKFRCGRESHKMLPSTKYAFIRMLIEENYIGVLKRILDNPIPFGIFLDLHTAKLFMHRSLIDKKYADAAFCAKHLMLQEEFGHSPIVTGLAVVSCLKYVLNEDEEVMKDYKPVLEEPEEDIEVRVKYIPNNCFDDHFHLTNDRHIVGKTFVYAAFHIEDSFIKHNIRILGWSLFEKWAELQDAIEDAKHANVHLATDIVSIIEQQIQKCEEADEVGKLNSSFESLKGLEANNVVNLMECVDKYLIKQIAEGEEKEIEDQEKLYTSWEMKRKTFHDEYLKNFQDTEKIQKINKLKEELLQEDQYVHFFDDEDQWLKDADDRNDAVEWATKTLKKLIGDEKEGDEYVVPEMSDMSQLLRDSLTKKKRVRRESRKYPRYQDWQYKLSEKDRKHCGEFLYGNWKSPTA